MLTVTSRPYEVGPAPKSRPDPGPGRAAAVRVYRSLLAPPGPVEPLAIGQVDRSPGEGHGRLATRRVPVRFARGQRPHHVCFSCSRVRSDVQGRAMVHAGQSYFWPAPSNMLLAWPYSRAGC